MTDTPLIVIVDDDPSIRAALQALMRSLGYRVQTFSCGEDFLRSQLIESTRCLIADVQMPGITGPELHARLISAGASVPTVLMTAYPNSGVGARALAAGAIGYLSKPFAEDQLLPYLHAALHGKNGVEATT
jgi:FixJ family two-component response regulator